MLVAAVKVGGPVDELTVRVEHVLSVHILQERNSVACWDPLEAPVSKFSLSDSVNLNVSGWATKLLLSKVTG